MGHQVVRRARHLGRVEQNNSAGKRQLRPNRFVVLHKFPERARQGYCHLPLATCHFPLQRSRLYRRLRCVVRRVCCKTKSMRDLALGDLQQSVALARSSSPVRKRRDPKNVAPSLLPTRLPCDPSPGAPACSTPPPAPRTPSPRRYSPWERASQSLRRSASSRSPARNQAQASPRSDCDR